jgi:hypothetical protein
VTIFVSGEEVWPAVSSGFPCDPRIDGLLCMSELQAYGTVLMFNLIPVIPE